MFVLCQQQNVTELEEINQEKSGREDLGEESKGQVLKGFGQEFAFPFQHNEWEPLKRFKLGCLHFKGLLRWFSRKESACQ